MKLAHGFSILALALSFSACAHKGKTEKEPELTPEQQAMQARQQSAQQAAQGAQEFQKQRDDYTIKAENKLNDLEAKIAALKAGAPADPAQRESYQSQIQTLETQLGSARDDLDGLKTATAQDWLERQNRVEQQIISVDAAYRAAAARLGH